MERRTGPHRLVLTVAAACLLGVLALPSGSAGAEGQDSAEPVPAPPAVVRGTAVSDVTDPEALRDAVEAEGTARVLVEFAVDSGVRIEAELSPANVRAQRRAIASARTGVVTDLGDDAEVVHAYRTLPAVALEVGAESLETLLDSPDVVSVMLDVPVPPALDYSAPAIEADVAHAAGADGDGFAVAILDTGVESTHPLFGGRVVAEGCFSTTWAAGSVESFCPGGLWGEMGAGAAADCPTSVSGCGHGTHVAGIAAGGNMTIASGPYAGRTITGVAPKADIIAVQVFSKFPKTYATCGGTNPCALSYTTDQIAGLEYVLALTDVRDIAAVNMSLGGGSYSATCNVGTSMETAIANLKAKGVATIIATGNNGYTGTIASPACTEGAVAVSSTVAVGAPSYVSSFSNTDSNLTDLYAPGYGILSSYVGGSYARLSGTSMATPQVTGAFAALREQSPDASVDEMVAALKSTGVAVSQRRPGTLPNWLPATKAYFPSVGFSVPEIRINQARLKLAANAWTIASTGTGRGTVASDSYSCTSTCRVPVNSGSTVTLTAVPDSGSAFTGWSGGGCTGTGNCTVSPTAATEITAEFARTTNDSFAAATAIELGPTETVLLVDTTGSTTEAGETVSCTVSGSASVWFTYTAPVSGTVSLTTRNSNYPAIMRVHTGSSLASLSSVGCNDGSDYWSDGYNLWPQLYTNATLSFSAVAGTTYRIQVGGENGFTGLLKLALDGPSTADAPAKPTTAVSGAGEVTVTATVPSGNGYAITGYAARCITGSTVATATGATPAVEVSGLTPETSYDCSIRAQTAVGWSPWSRPQQATAADVPSTPAAPGTSVTGSSVTVTASAPDGRGSPVIGYEARCTAASGDTATVASSGTELTISTLVGGEDYGCSVRAENLAGWSEWSADTDASVPAVPETPSAPAVETVVGAATVTYEPPSPKGSAIIGYEARCTASGLTTRTATGSALSLAVSGLANEATYQCSVRAENGIGWSAWSSPTAAVMPSVPSRPVAPTLRLVAGSVTVTYPAPSARGSAIIGYEARCTASGLTTRTATGSALSLAVSGLANEATYQCSVRAENGIGWSAWSSPTAAVMPSVPSRPVAPTLRLVAGSVTVTYPAPSARGSAIIGYEARCTASGLTTRTATGSALSLVVSGLANRATYQCSVRAQNAVGWSEWSPSSAARTPDVPSAPAAPVLAAAVRSARVRLSAPAANGSPVTLFEVQCKRTGEQARSVVIAAYSVTLTRLASRKRYSCSVRAQNAVGWSEWSRASYVTPR